MALGIKTGGRRKVTPNKETAVARALTDEFFARILDDATEEVAWRKFMGSYDENIAWKAFCKAVEYKRGQPISRTDVTSNGRTVGFDVPLIPGMEQAEQRPNVN